MPSCLELHTIPPEDPVVYDMICEADTIGVFQIESRAQMAMAPRLKPRCYYDLVIQVAIVRPGPIQGGMVHPYLRRRAGIEPIEFPNKEVERVLGKTMGVPLFQEQAMSLAIVAAGFTPGEADQLRRAMAAWKRSGDAIYRFERKLIDGMIERGYPEEFARQAFTQITGFSGYGFPESHAASFALLVYASCWLKRHHPAAFAAALINSQPMGFYAPAQIVRDAREHGVEVRPVDVNASAWDCTLEEPRERAGGAPGDDRATWGFGGPAIRLGMRLISGLGERDAERIVKARERWGGIRSIDQLRAGGVRVGALKRLAAADAFGSLGLDRQRASWRIGALRDEPLPLFEGASGDEPEGRLPEIALPHHVAQDYHTTGLSLKQHPVSFLRGWLDESGVTRAGELADGDRWPQGRTITVAGIVLNRQRPSTASGIVFMTLEDETGIANLIVLPEVFERCRRAARHSTIVSARGRVERQGKVVHVKVGRIDSLDGVGVELTTKSRDFH